MRAIKFRAWDGEEMRLSPSTSEGLHHLATWFDAHSTFGFAERERDSEIMQFTGLKDKNGKEIFEGDLIRHNHIPRDLAVVRFVDGAFKAGGILASTYHSSVIEVAGNIYENPEMVA